MTEDKILWVARYVEGDMDDAEVADFESRLADDAELQQNLSNYKDIHQSLKMKLSDNEELEHTLKGLNKQYFGEETKVVSFKPTIKWLGAVAAVLVIGLFIWAPWNNSLYNTYNDHSDMLVTERGATEAGDLVNAAALYNAKNYAAAKAMLQKLYAKQKTNAMIGYYYGLSLLKTNEVEQSREVLTPIYDGESVFKYDAAYAIALGYLKENNKADCKAWLTKIPEGTTRYQQAQDLLGEL
ncbi:hypothetical protein [Pedobacter insulae]|uniref:Tetratricopeptide repeat-containing protein n=1 Tax=Pedobacter insulae TaxID=414048 RepID=A0A1I2VUV5_9SPHI|nr:hypothetical protein [Pedobacter insulae]SFG92157.1 hypothetical protein SAMN04489864_103235 [Pedobacter insulae]